MGITVPRANTILWTSLPVRWSACPPAPNTPPAWALGNFVPLRREIKKKVKDAAREPLGPTPRVTVHWAGAYNKRGRVRKENNETRLEAFRHSNFFDGHSYSDGPSAILSGVRRRAEPGQ